MIAESANQLQIRSGRGIVICGGGCRYSSNAWVNLRLLRMHGVTLPVEIWMLREEYVPVLDKILEPFGAVARICDHDSAESLPPGARWQWLLKPWSDATFSI